MQKSKSQLKPLKISEHIDNLPVGAVIGLDVMVVSGFDPEEYSSVLSSTCILSKWVRAEPLVWQTAEHILEKLDRMFAHTVYPLVIVSDNASVFKSKLMKRYCVRHNIRQCFIPPHASSYAGWYERTHKGLLAGLRTMAANKPNCHWSEHLPRSCFLLNTRPYSLDDPTGLCPAHLVFTNSRVSSQDIPADDITPLLETAGLSHLITPSTDELLEYGRKAMERRVKALRTYEHLFNAKREQVRERLLRRHRDSTGNCPVGSFVRVYRPVACKTTPRWSELREVIGAPSAGTRLVKRPDSSPSIEWIANLLPGECSDGIGENENITETRK